MRNRQKFGCKSLGQSKFVKRICLRSAVSTEVNIEEIKARCPEDITDTERIYLPFANIGHGERSRSWLQFKIFKVRRYGYRNPVNFGC